MRNVKTIFNLVENLKDGKQKNKKQKEIIKF